MEHTVFTHLGAWVALTINFLGLGLIVWQGGKAMGILGASVNHLSLAVGELKIEVAKLREEIVDQGKEVAHMQGVVEKS